MGEDGIRDRRGGRGIVPPFRPLHYNSRVRRFVTQKRNDGANRRSR